MIGQIWMISTISKHNDTLILPLKEKLEIRFIIEEKEIPIIGKQCVGCLNFYRRATDELIGSIPVGDIKITKPLP